ncbi:LEAF RUST 10 DISEASE-RESISTANCEUS RECEPTOR-LIKE PROTEIN KINASE-like 2.1 [Pyrus communis]|uniref:LEAF RUST 10 DISEASE-RESISTANCEUS RECEPTOR-LIKE PROTEIN KINASE-like 2.1 n=1 Tax=Pyrus communis TaxID=23211 RepID=UPI0035BEC8C1
MEKSGSRSFTLSWWPFVLAFLVLCFCSETCNAKDDSKSSCTSSCGLIYITSPFRLNDDPKKCGDRRYTLSCENNNTTVLEPLGSGKYYVQAINYKNKTIRLLDPGLDNNNCSSMPRNFPHYYFPVPYGSPLSTSTSVFYLMCRNPVNSSLYVDTAPCLNNSATSLIQPKSYSYVMVGRPGYLDMEDWNEGCSVERMAWMLLDYSKGYYNASYSYEYIHSALMYGFELRLYWPDELRSPCNGTYSFLMHLDYNASHSKCFPRTIPGFFQYVWAQIRKWSLSIGYTLSGTADLGYLPRWFPFHYIHSIALGWEILMGIALFFTARLLFGIPIAAVFLVYKWRRRHLSMYNTIEDFLQRDKNFVPIRYSYSDIKKMTRRFKDKLGEGGYGSVFKGKLRSGRFVAIKVLGKSKANGQDFISEIATIGRIHHANVVRLIGYCVEGSKRALVYEFMANGSLDKYIYSKEGSVPLTIDKMYEISLGVAQGIEYLHQGCAMQILHFDIKPHNILLDENFKAKVSDFGLAKLYPVDNSIVTLTAARGTMGYIAPELFYKNIGGVSHKADVYSFGMLLMEMASRRKNLNTTVEHSSQIYFPLWVYDQYNVGNDLEMDNVTEEEKNVIRKMVIIALWCIQMKPTDRPSMHKVIEMLGGDVECLQMPPRPSLCPQETPVAVGDIQDPICSNVEITCSLAAR